MRIVISDFMSLDGVVQAPAGPDEDRDGAWSRRVMGSATVARGRRP